MHLEESEIMFLRQIVADIVADPEVAVVANANSRHKFEGWLAGRLDGYFASRFLRNQELIEQAQTDTALQEALCELTFGRLTESNS